MTQITDIIRRPGVKMLTRLILYGLAAILAKLGAATATAEGPAEAIAEGVFAAGALIAAALLDRWHHKRDLAETPPVAPGAP